MIEVEEELLDFAGTGYFDYTCYPSCPSTAASEASSPGCVVMADSTDHTAAAAYLDYTAATKSPCSAGFQITKD